MMENREKKRKYIKKADRQCYTSSKNAEINHEKQLVNKKKPFPANKKTKKPFLFKFLDKKRILLDNVLESVDYNDEVIPLGINLFACPAFNLAWYYIFLRQKYLPRFPILLKKTLRPCAFEKRICQKCGAVARVHRNRQRVLCVPCTKARDYLYDRALLLKNRARKLAESQNPTNI